MNKHKTFHYTLEALMIWDRQFLTQRNQEIYSPFNRGIAINVGTAAGQIFAMREWIYDRMPGFGK